MDNLPQCMPFLLIGLNHKVAPLEVRERLAFGPQRIPRVLNEWMNAEVAGVCEAVLLSTCNRTECYLNARDFEQAEVYLLNFLVRHAGLEPSLLRGMLYILRGEQVAAHLMKVATGMDSLILGENEILGQVRQAADLAHEAGATGPMLSALFRYAVQAGKRARAETEIGRSNISIASVVVELAEKTLGCLRQRTALLIGAGKISSITARALTDAGLHFVMVANRTFERAEKLAHSLNGQAVHFDRLGENLAQADIVICSTGAPHILLHTETVAKAQQERQGRPLLVADLSLPRDADPAIASIPGVTLVNIDNLDQAAKTSHTLSAPVCQQVEAIIAQELGKFNHWCNTRRCAPVIQALYEKAENITQGEVEETLRRLGPLTPHQERLVQAMGKAIAGKLLHGPTSRLREIAEEDDPNLYLDLIQDLYGI